VLEAIDCHFSGFFSLDSDRSHAPSSPDSLLAGGEVEFSRRALGRN
jgi:hypothetical protein